MPDLAQLHPQIVHFVVALLIVGVLTRLVALSGKVRFADRMATTLILIGTAAAVLAVESGLRAHGPAERVPGARAAVVEHEEWGERTRNVFLGVAALELIAFGLAMRSSRYSPYRKHVLVVAALAGVAGVVVLYEAAEHGGKLVYSYAGGVGVRSGAPEDVERLLVAGLYHEAMLDRRENRPEEAARLLAELVRRRPDDPNVRLLAVESLILDKKDGLGALTALRGISVPAESRPLRFRYGWLLADAYEAAGFPDSALAALEELSVDFPRNDRLRQRLEELR